MRDDMARVLVGRPRLGPRVRIKRAKLHQNPCRSVDDTMRRDPMSRGRGTKDLNENLAPLVRYLGSQLGRPWDKVYSEICERLRPTSTVQQHVRDHLEDYVVIHTWMEGGEVHGHYPGHLPVVLSRPGAWRVFYVDPRDGELREQEHAPWPRYRADEPDPEVRWDGAWRQLRRIDGVWYAFRLAPIPDGANDRFCLRDRFLGRMLEDLLRNAETNDALLRAYGRPGVFAAEKRQLGKRELRKVGKLPVGRKRVKS
jgi:hypothetical protein